MGSTIFYLAADNDSDDFVELDRHQCGTGDVPWARTTAENGGANTAYSVRVTEFTVKAVDTDGPGPGVTAKVWIACTSFALMAAATFGVWLIVRLRRARRDLQAIAQRIGSNTGNIS